MNKYNFLSPEVLILEALTICAILLLSLRVPSLGFTWFCTLSCWMGRIAKWRKLSITLIGLLAFGGSLSVSILVYMPEPQLHDEFSNLLAADTFAHGRLSNPTHPLWIHFESMHIIQQPSYASKYPPAQGLVLAVGQLIGGHPIVGVWVSSGLMCAAIYWMLLAWLPPSWAFLGGLIVLGRFGIFGYWSQSYWGGAIAALGGALVFGSLQRIMHKKRVLDATLMGVGLAILANSRPFEGMIVSLPVVSVLLAWIVSKKGPSVRVLIRRIILPILAILTLTGGTMAFYNWSVTGSAKRMPYQVYEATYATTPIFLWQRSKAEPTYRHKVMREFNRLIHEQYIQNQSIYGFLRAVMARLVRLWYFYLGLLLTVPLLTLMWMYKDRRIRFALLTCSLLMVILVFVESWSFPHYAAPMTGLIFVMILQSMRYLRLWRWRGNQAGRFIVRAIVMSVFVSLVLSFVLQLNWALHRKPGPRTQILSQLKEEGGYHLVIVRYGTEHSPHSEWVYNEADIDSANVVWAREMNEVQNRKLLDYFNDRHVWLVEADLKDPKLVQYHTYQTFD